jgi:hypothetical protein
MLRGKSGYYISSHELMPLLGFKSGGHLPKQGFGPRVVEGVTFKCDPAAPDQIIPVARRKWSASEERIVYRTEEAIKKVSTHRVKYLCPHCDRWIPFGRANQHNPACSPKVQPTIDRVPNPSIS